MFYDHILIIKNEMKKKWLATNNRSDKKSVKFDKLAGGGTVWVVEGDSVTHVI